MPDAVAPSVEPSSARAASAWMAAFFPGPAFALAREAVDVWAAASGVWLDWVMNMGRLLSPATFLETEPRLLAEVLEIGSEAEAEHLRAAGLTTPLLSDA